MLAPPARRDGALGFVIIRDRGIDPDQAAAAAAAA
jgi:hypothetical protein